MPGSVTDRSRYIEHKNKPQRFLGGSWTEPYGSISIFEDFLVDALADTPYVTVTSSGTATAAAAISATAGDPVPGHGGWLAGATDDVDAEIDEIAVGGLAATASVFRADRAGTGLLVCEWAFTVPTALTTRQYFVGVSDDPTEGTGTNGPMNITGTTTIVSPASDAAGFILSSLATAPTVWKGASVDTDVDSALLTGPTAVADTFTRLRVEIDSDGNCYLYGDVGNGYTDGRALPFVGTTSVGTSPDVLLVPIFTAAPTTTTAVPWELDWVLAACAR
jgi:hypothetical protein